mgnify:CR=1 FL=1
MHTPQRVGHAVLFTHSLAVGHRMRRLSEAEVSLISAATGKPAVLIRFREERKRKWDSWAEDGQYHTVLLDGWDWPPLPEKFDADGRAKFASFEGGWNQLFDDYLRAALATRPDRLLLDLRGWNQKMVVAAQQPSLLPNLHPAAEQRRSVAPLVEAAASEVTLTRHERNPEARRRCIEHFGLSCQACAMNFATVYGDVGEGFIHVHHLSPLGKAEAEREVDPLRDLRPVCANCHAMLHRREPPLTIQELRDLIGVASTR